MKRTPERGVKQNLKPFAYKQWEPFFGGVTAYLLYNGSASYFSVASLTV